MAVSRLATSNLSGLHSPSLLRNAAAHSPLADPVAMVDSAVRVSAHFHDLAAIAAVHDDSFRHFSQGFWMADCFVALPCRFRLCVNNNNQADLGSSICAAGVLLGKCLRRNARVIDAQLTDQSAE
jgi:hypothetical protein